MGQHRDGLAGLADVGRPLFAVPASPGGVVEVVAGQGVGFGGRGGWQGALGRGVPGGQRDTVFAAAEPFGERAEGGPAVVPHAVDRIGAAPRAAGEKGIAPAVAFVLAGVVACRATEFIGAVRGRESDFAPFGLLPRQDQAVFAASDGTGDEPVAVVNGGADGGQAADGVPGGSAAEPVGESHAAHAEGAVTPVVSARPVAHETEAEVGGLPEIAVVGVQGAESEGIFVGVHPPCGTFRGGVALPGLGGCFIA